MLISAVTSRKESASLNFACNTESKEAWFVVRSYVNGKAQSERFEDFGEAVDRYNEVKAIIDGGKINARKDETGSY